MRRPPRALHVAPDAAADHRIVLVTTAAATIAITTYTSAQSFLLHTSGADIGIATSAVAVAVAAIVMLSAIHLLCPERHGPVPRTVLVALLGLGAALTFVGARALLRLSAGTRDAATVCAGEFAGVALAAACAAGLGLLQVDIARRIRGAERGQSLAQARAAGLVAELQEEELRLRYELAETIHGSVQGTFVVLETRLRHVAASLRERDPASADELRVVAGQLERLREKELRALSARLYPVDLERGLGAAVRALLVRLPPSVAVTAPAIDVFVRVEHRLSHEARVLVARVIEDALSNALRHGGADEVAVGARDDGDVLRITVVNNGSPPSPDAQWSGLERLRRRAEVLGGDLHLAPDGRSGARLTLRIPLPPPNARSLP